MSTKGFRAHLMERVNKDYGFRVFSLFLGIVQLLGCNWAPSLRPFDPASPWCIAAKGRSQSHGAVLVGIVDYEMIVV